MKDLKQQKDAAPLKSTLQEEGAEGKTDSEEQQANFLDAVHELREYNSHQRDLKRSLVVSPGSKLSAHQPELLSSKVLDSLLGQFLQFQVRICAEECIDELRQHRGVPEQRLSYEEARLSESPIISSRR